MSGRCSHVPRQLCWALATDCSRQGRFVGSEGEAVEWYERVECQRACCISSHLCHMLLLVLSMSCVVACWICQICDNVRVCGRTMRIDHRVAAAAHAREGGSLAVRAPRSCCLEPPRHCTASSLRPIPTCTTMKHGFVGDSHRPCTSCLSLPYVTCE